MWDFAGDGWVHRLVLQKSDPLEDEMEIGMGSGTGTANVDGGLVPFSEQGLGKGQGHGVRVESEQSVIVKNNKNGNGDSDDEYRGNNKKNNNGNNNNNSASGRSFTSNISQGVRVKLVEIPDPTSNLPYRSRARVPPLSTDEAEVEVNR